MIEKLLQARRAGTPLVAITTSDPACTIKAIAAKFAETKDGTPISILTWDCINGIEASNKSAKNWLNLKKGDLGNTVSAIEALEAAHKLPPFSILIIMNAHTGVDNAVWRQAVWNLRDAYKKDNRQLILLAPGIELPAELSNDVYVIDEALPSPPELRQIVTDLLASASRTRAMELPDDAMISKAVDALCGLSAFSAEQCISMSLFTFKQNAKEFLQLKLDELWDRKRRIIEATAGLSVYRGTETFDDIAGLSNVKQYMSRVMLGKRSPRCIGFIDEGEKMFAGAAGGDSSGVSQGFLGSFLSWMEDSGSRGLLLVGVPGAGKSILAKASGHLAGVPVVSMDMNAMKGGYVGDSERNIRVALKTISSISQGRCFFIMTCNKLTSLPPELRRRFPTLFFVDIPSAEDRKAIWPIHLRAYGLPFDSPLPRDDDWTGADIRNCCDNAVTLYCSLIEAASYVTPVGKTAAELIDSLRREAHGKYLDAAKPGLYQFADSGIQEGANRALEVMLEGDDDAV